MERRPWFRSPDRRRSSSARAAVLAGTAVAACIGDDARGPELQVIDLAAHRRWAIPLPGRPRWCVPDAADAEDIVQEVFYELVEANRLLMPIEHVTGWLFRVARNRITDLWRKKKPQRFTDTPIESG